MKYIAMSIASQRSVMACCISYSITIKDILIQSRRKCYDSTAINRSDLGYNAKYNTPNISIHNR